MYNYADLNDVEFEELCKDVMQNKLNEHLRTFARGKDKGIDIRNDNDSIVIQVKHYEKSPYSMLKGSLNKEILKVKEINPKKYYLCISKELTPQQIDEIYDIFKQYMYDKNSIITIKEIDDFLQKEENQGITKKHFKLWLSSSNILEKIGQNDICIDCESLLYNINEEVKYFVKTNMFDKCLEILENERVLAIVGMPGVGKTTTSKMLILKYIEKGYQVRYSTNIDISNIKKAISINPNVKEIILLDDCLGQHYLNMEEKQENEIISLIKYIKSHTNKVLIMNSRITIFNEAKKRSEEFNNIIEDKDIKVYTINMDNIEKIEKAKIFYNHLYFNNLDNAYFQEIKKDKRYINIIEHRNYNPRIIQYICKKVKTRIESNDYYKYIMECLENPSYIWKNEYYERIEKEDRIFLLVLYSMSDNMVKYEVMEKAFNRRIEAEDIDTSKNCFIAVIKRLNESMIKVTIKNKERFISVLNPSVNDFLKNEFYNNEAETNKILEKAISIEQIERIFNKNLKDKEEYIKNKIIDGTILNYTYLNENYSIQSIILAYIVHFEINYEKYKNYIQEGLKNFNYNYFEFYDGMQYEKSDIVDQMLKSNLYKYYDIYKKISKKDFVEDMISDLDVESMLSIIYIVNNKFDSNLKKMPEDILDTISTELNYTLNQYLEDYEIKYFDIDIDDILYKKREELEEKRYYYDTEEELEEEMMKSVKEEVEYIVEQNYERIKDELCINLPKEIKNKINIYCVYNDDKIQEFIKNSLEVKKDYNIDEIIDNNENDIVKEIDKIFNRSPE